MSWRDEFLVWDPDKYNGTNLVHLPASLLWKPDIVLYQSVDEEPLSGNLGLSCTVTNNGVVRYNTPYIFISYCKVDLTYYPFDTQRCGFKFGSWSYDETGVNITASVTIAELGNYVKNGEWELDDMIIEPHVVNYSCCPHPFTDVEYTIVISRMPEFYIYNIILPYVLISILSIFVFYLPPESGEKMNLSITTMLSLIVFNQLVISTIPPASDGTFPIIGKYFIMMIAIVALSVLMSVWVLHLYHKEHNAFPMPPLLKRFVFDILGRCVGRLKQESHPKPWQLRQESPKSGKFRCPTNRDSLLFKGLKSFTRLNSNDVNAHPGNSHAHSPKGSISCVSEDCTCTQNTCTEELIMDGTLEMLEIGSDNRSRLTIRVEKDVGELVKLVDYLTERKKVKDADEDIAWEWREAAAVVDRAFLILFILINISLPTFFLLAATKRI
ncbi:neuronal acetylcholine receptor subunit alpha-3-like isoform X2 [Amphiura filiformis]|uniref:neuronal acetylcholine receptor subunit alpha-3-like isoform X2 n=1 Tax=Amphiura filiformis TaxID=82378 RepID=UPI003B227B1F